MRPFALRHMFLLVAGLGLAACDEAALGLAGGGSDVGVRTLALYDGSVRAGGPEGYCIDRAASNARRGFAVLAGCALLSAEEVMPRLDGVIAVQFAEANSAVVRGREADMATFLQSADGRATLSRNGSAEQVAVLFANSRANRVIIAFQDGAGPAMAGTAGPVWRGFMDINGRLVTVSVHSSERKPLEPDDARRLLEIAMVELTGANAATAPDPQG